MSRPPLLFDPTPKTTGGPRRVLCFVGWHDWRMLRTGGPIPGTAQRWAITYCKVCGKVRDVVQL